ncbi:MAG: hypothetical protein WCV62_05505 [Candidatus Peribacteraceae bacterium]|jgi:hypothetical protein
MTRLAAACLTGLLLFTSASTAYASPRRGAVGGTSADPGKLDLRWKNNVQSSRPSSPSSVAPLIIGQHALRNVTFSAPTGGGWVVDTGEWKPTNGWATELRKSTWSPELLANVYSTSISVGVAPITLNYTKEQLDGYFTRLMTQSPTGDGYGDYYVPNYASAGDPTDTELLGLPARKYRFTVGKTQRGEAIFATKDKMIYSVIIIAKLEQYEEAESVYQEITRTLSFLPQTPSSSSVRSSSSSASPSRIQRARQQRQSKRQERLQKRLMREKR